MFISFCRFVITVWIMIEGCRGADVTLTCPEIVTHGQTVTIQCALSQKASSLQCPALPVKKERRNKMQNSPAIRFEFMYHGFIARTSDPELTQEGVFVLSLSNGAGQCSPEAKWTDNVRCISKDGQGEAVYEYRFTADRDLHHGLGMRCYVGCSVKNYRRTDFTYVVKDECDPLRFDYVRPTTTTLPGGGGSDTGGGEGGGGGRGDGAASDEYEYDTNVEDEEVMPTTTSIYDNPGYLQKKPLPVESLLAGIVMAFLVVLVIGGFLWFKYRRTKGGAPVVGGEDGGGVEAGRAVVEGGGGEGGMVGGQAGVEGGGSGTAGGSGQRAGSTSKGEQKEETGVKAENQKEEAEAKTKNGLQEEAALKPEKPSQEAAGKEGQISHDSISSTGDSSGEHDHNAADLEIAQYGSATDVQISVSKGSGD